MVASAGLRRGPGQAGAQAGARPGLGASTPLLLLLALGVSVAAAAVDAVAPVGSMAGDGNLGARKLLGVGTAAEGVGAHVATGDLSQLRLAVAVAVTSDGPYGDALAVLHESVRAVYPRALRGDAGPGSGENNTANPHAVRSMLRVDTVAILTPKVQRMRPMLREFGWILREFEGPGMSYDELQDEGLRENIKKAGCCGLDEMLKLRAFQLTEYDRVLVLDGDTLLLGNIDRLWALDVTLAYTRDGAGGGVRPPEDNGEYPFQGGVFMVRPDQATYERVVHGFRSGQFHKNGLGWNDSGSGFWYGGGTIQGLLPYMFRHVLRQAESLELDRCLYDNMGDEARCKALPESELRVYHFTVCSKPWSGYVFRSRHDQCLYAQEMWWEFRRQIESARGLPGTETCTHRGRYTPIDVAANDKALYKELCDKEPYCAWVKELPKEG